MKTWHVQTDLSFRCWPRCHLTDNIGLLLGVRVVDAHHPESGNNINIVSECVPSFAAIEVHRSSFTTRCDSGVLDGKCR